MVGQFVTWKIWKPQGCDMACPRTAEPLRGGFPGAADTLDDVDHILDFF